MQIRGQRLKLTLLTLAAVALLLLVQSAQARQPGWEIREDGKFYDNGQWVFLKIAKPLRNFGLASECQGLINALPTLKAKHYNAFELNCYWHQFDMDGDGTVDVSLEPLKALINAIYDMGMYPCLTVET